MHFSLAKTQRKKALKSLSAVVDAICKRPTIGRQAWVSKRRYEAQRNPE
jgi:hypothetical protein